MSQPAAIPVLQTGNNELDRFAEVVKQNLDTLTGQQKNIARLVPLTDTASTSEIVARLNALLARLQG